MGEGQRGDCNKCGNDAEIVSLDSEILCPMCLFKSLNRKISNREIDAEFFKLWENFEKIAKPLLQMYS